MLMPQHIGIVACSAEGASLCYRTLCADGARLLGSRCHLELVAAHARFSAAPITGGAASSSAWGWR
jgi:hypothetical protein